MQRSKLILILMLEIGIMSVARNVLVGGVGEWVGISLLIYLFMRITLFTTSIIKYYKLTRQLIDLWVKPSGPHSDLAHQQIM